MSPSAQSRLALLGPALEETRAEKHFKETHKMQIVNYTCIYNYIYIPRPDKVKKKLYVWAFFIFGPFDPLQIKLECLEAKLYALFPSFAARNSFHQTDVHTGPSLSLWCGSSVSMDARSELCGIFFQ